MALACEAAGFFYVGVCDHTLIPSRLAGAMSTTWYDTIATLGWLAGITSEIRLLSHVYVIALRHPLRAAKEFATLDVLSGGRVICGVGAGHVSEEFDLMGPAFDRARTRHRRGHRRPGRRAGGGVPAPERAPMAGHRCRTQAPPGAVASPTHLGRWVVAGRPTPRRQVRRRLAATIARSRCGAPGHAAPVARGVPGWSATRHRRHCQRHVCRRSSRRVRTTTGHGGRFAGTAGGVHPDVRRRRGGSGPGAIPVTIR